MANVWARDSLRASSPASVFDGVGAVGVPAAGQCGIATLSLRVAGAAMPRKAKWSAFVTVPVTSAGYYRLGVTLVTSVGVSVATAPPAAATQGGVVRNVGWPSIGWIVDIENLLFAPVHMPTL